MAIVNLGGVKGIQHSETIATGTNGNSIIVSPIGNQSGYVGVKVIPSGNTGKIQSTMSSLAKINAGTAIWTDWAEGNVTATTEDAVTGITGLRGVSVSGAIDIEVVI